MEQQISQLKQQLAYMRTPEMQRQLKQALSVVLLSFNSMRRACLHPYVQDKVKTCFKPVLVVAVGIWAVGLVLVVPITIIAFLLHLLSLGYLDTSTVSSGASSLLYDATTVIPLLSVALLRQFIRKPLDKCFIHMLCEVNPKLAERLESSPKLQGEHQRSRKPLVASYLNQTVALIALELGVHVLHRVPYVGVFAHPVLHFLTVSRTLHSTPAIALSVLSLVPYFGTPVKTVVRLWRASNVLGAEMVGDYVSKAIPQAERAAFWKRNGLTVTLFMLPQMALMKIPVLGAAVVFPMAASAAWLVDLLAGNAPDASAQTVHSTSQGPAPTMPVSPLPQADEQGLYGHGGTLKQRAGYGSQQPGSSFPAGGMQQPSAPPIDPALLRTRV